MKIAKLTLLILIPFASFNLSQAQTGQLAPGAVKIDADDISHLSLGSAVIKKNKRTALIQHNGKTILPFGIYKIQFNTLEMSQGYLHRGFYEVTSDELPNGGVINSKGKLVYKPPFGADFQLENADNNLNDIFCVVTENTYGKEGDLKTNTLLISHDGKVHRFGNKAIRGVGEGMVTFIDNETGLAGYADTAGKILVNASFPRAFNFKQGLAAVSIKDEDELKWGFIDRTGKFKIEPKYKWAPSDFSEGLSAFIDLADSKPGGFIDVNGDTVINTPPVSVFGYDYNRRTSEFVHGYFIGHGQIVKRDGSMINEAAFMQSFGLDTAVHIGPRTRTNQTQLVANSKYGILFLDSKKVIEPVFSWIDLFEPGSDLTKAVLELDKNTTRTGLVNKEGKFVLYFDFGYGVRK